MEDGLGALKGRRTTWLGAVLILVLVEDGLGELIKMPTLKKNRVVLILVLVEDGLGARLSFCLSDTRV